MTSPAGTGKKRRTGANLLDLGRDAFVSQSGITSLLNTVTKDGIPSAQSRRSIFRDRKAFVASATPYGQLLQRRDLHLTDGSKLTIGVQTPMAMTHKCFDECAGFRAMVQAAVRAHGLATPWRLILYNDGVTPQDSASAHDKRKLINVYWTLAEYGQRALTSEEAWSVLCTLRTSKVELYKGGLSRFVREALDAYFTEFEQRGVALPDGSGVLRAKLWCFVADEPALKDFFLFKGHGGLLPCILCYNVMLQRFFDQALHGPLGFVSTACFDDAAFKRHTDASIRTLFLERRFVLRGRRHGLLLE